jgi:hypothetical protein
MNRQVSIICFALFSLVNGPGILHAENAGSMKPPVAVGQWTVSVDRDEGGHFMDCSARAIAPDSQSGIGIMILANANFWLTLTNATWQFDDRPVPVRLHIDDYDLGLQTMNPIEARSAYINLGNLRSNRNMQMALEAGSKLEAIIGSDTTTFSLKDIDKAFGELINCAMTGIGHPGG